MTAATTRVFYFAWVNPTDTTYSSAFQRMDENLFTFKLEHAEGGFPQLTVEIVNPRIGLLNSTRKQWIWFSCDLGPIFFGRLVGLPSDLIADIITLQFIARPQDYIPQKQLVAEALKVPPYYDDVFIAREKRDDPDTILEAYSRLFHVDRLTLQVTTSDVLVGEDGTETFQATDSFLDSVQMHLQQSPLVAVQVDATVGWTQTAWGFLAPPNKTFITYSGDGILADWPKSNTDFGGGWSCAYSYAGDSRGADKVTMVQLSRSWQNTEKQHNDGDEMSVQEEATVPTGQTWKDVAGDLKNAVTTMNQVGLIDPFAVDVNGDPAPVNRPAILKQTYTYALQYNINASITFKYMASRKRTERAFLYMTADVQPILNDPLVTQDTELLQLTGADVSIPIINLLNWSSVAGQHVNVGQLVFPDNPTVPGQTSTQICVVAGTAGAVEPVFSPIEGVTTVDGTVTWSSLGPTSPPDNAPDWTQQTDIPLGAILLPRQPQWLNLILLQQTGLVALPQQGTSISLGQVVQAPNGFFQVCTQAGVTAVYYPRIPVFGAAWGAITIDGTTVWTCLGATIPDGNHYFICTHAGQTGTVLPPFNNTLNAVTNDGTAQWTCVGPADLPIGGTLGQVWRRSYFPTARGNQSLQYFMCRARARLRIRARAVEVKFDCRFERAFDLTLRKNAALYDSRLPGGLATGKIISYSMEGSGDKGTIKGTVTIGCAVGNGNTVTTTPGSPTYVTAPGYVNPGYQEYTGTTVFVDPDVSDLNYTPPADTAVDDGLVFPLNWAQVCELDVQIGSYASQSSAVLLGFQNAVYAANTGNAVTTAVENAIADQQAAAAANFKAVGDAIATVPIVQMFVLKPVAGQQFEWDYTIGVSKLMVPQLINLEAPSS